MSWSIHYQWRKVMHYHYKVKLEQNLLERKKEAMKELLTIWQLLKLIWGSCKWLKIGISFIWRTRTSSILTKKLFCDCSFLMKLQYDTPKNQQQKKTKYEVWKQLDFTISCCVCNGFDIDSTKFLGMQMQISKYPIKTYFFGNSWMQQTLRMRIFRANMWARFWITICENGVSYLYFMKNTVMLRCSVIKIIIRPESDHWECLSLTDSLTNSLTAVQ